MEARSLRGDHTDKTLVLGPLDTFPVLADRMGLTDVRVHTGQLGSGVPVSVRGASVVPDRRPPSDEELAFLLGPSWSLRLRRGLRSIASGGPREALAQLRALAPYVRAARAALSHEITRARMASVGVAADLRRMDGVQRRTAAGAFLAGVVLSTVVAWIA